MKTEFYPISLPAISMKVAQKNGRRRKSQKEGQPFLFEHQFVDNTKKIKNAFGEEVMRVDGDIPVNLSVNDDDRGISVPLRWYPRLYFGSPEDRADWELWCHESEDVYDVIAWETWMNTYVLKVCWQDERAVKV